MMNLRLPLLVPMLPQREIFDYTAKYLDKNLVRNVMNFLRKYQMSKTTGIDAYTMAPAARLQS